MRRRAWGRGGASWECSSIYTGSPAAVMRAGVAAWCQKRPAVGRRPRASDLVAKPWGARGPTSCAWFLAGVARNVPGDELHRSALSLRFSRRSNALGVHAVTRSRSMLSIIAAYGLYVCSASCRFKGVPGCACRRAGENTLLERRRALFVCFRCIAEALL